MSVRAFRWSASVAVVAAVISSGALAQKKKSEGAEVKPVPAYYGPQPSVEPLDTAMYQRIREEGTQHSKVMDLAGALSDDIGPRLTGSPNLSRAYDWAIDTLTKMGLSNAHKEDWGEFGMGWQQINTWARMITPEPEPLWMQAAPFSFSTNGPVKGDIVYLDPSSTTADSIKGKLAGKIVLFGAMRPTPDITEPLFHRYTDGELKEMEGPQAPRGNRGGPVVSIADRLRLRAQQQALAKAVTAEGPAAIILPTRDMGDGGGTGIIADDNGSYLVRDAQKADGANKIPTAVMMIEHYNRLARLSMHHVPVQLEVNIETKISGDHEHGYNVVAEIPGTDPKLKDQVVMVGGHFDSWISGTGATDNGAGTVAAMEAVRILKALDVHPKRTIRVALWTGEEEGEFGSAGYVKTHFGAFAPVPSPDGMPAFMSRTRGPLTTTKEWETLDAYYNLDNGTGKVRGVYVEGNYAIAPIFAQWIAPLRDMGVTTITMRNTGGTDHQSFDAVGLPGFQYIQDPMDYETRTHHTDMDTFDRLHEGDLEQSAIVEAIFLWNTSEREQMMPRKPFPHPENDKSLDAPIPGLYPGATEDAGATQTGRRRGGGQ